MLVPEDVSEVNLFHSGNDLVSGFSSVIVSITVVMVIELREDTMQYV